MLNMNQKSLQELCQQYSQYGYGVILLYQKHHDEFGTMLECLAFTDEQSALKWVDAIQRNRGNGELPYFVTHAYCVPTNISFNF